jgi:hypothetical protein
MEVPKVRAGPTESFLKKGDIVKLVPPNSGLGTNLMMVKWTPWAQNMISAFPWASQAPFSVGSDTPGGIYFLRSDRHPLWEAALDVDSPDELLSRIPYLRSSRMVSYSQWTGREWKEVGIQSSWTYVSGRPGLADLSSAPVIDVEGNGTSTYVASLLSTLNDDADVVIPSDIMLGLRSLGAQYLDGVTGDAYVTWIDECREFFNLEAVPGTVYLIHSFLELDESFRSPQTDLIEMPDPTLRSMRRLLGSLSSEPGAAWEHPLFKYLCLGAHILHVTYPPMSVTDVHELGSSESDLGELIRLSLSSVE